MKGKDCIDYIPPSQASWIVKAIFKHNEELMSSTVWDEFRIRDGYRTRDMYKMLRGVKPKVRWKKVIMGNCARPKSTFITWMALLGRLPTKDRLHRFGIQNDGLCVFCGTNEDIQHVLFECDFAINI